MSWLKSKANIILVAVSCVIALFLFEQIYEYVLKKESDYRWDARYMLFSDHSGGNVIRNVENFFVYQPNKKIHSKTYYFVNGSWVKEYDYLIPTNNLGLVQANNTQLNVSSVLLLGDSFTEGQGASPWFENLLKNFSQKSLQFVNGGILGTGFQQWQILHDFLLTEGVNVKYLVVIFISDDYTRGIWNFPSHTLNCLADYHRCVGNENFYGIPADEELNVYLEKLRAYREERSVVNNASFKEHFKYYLPATTKVIRFLKYSFARLVLNDLEVELNRKVISNLIARYKDNVLFIHIPQRDEVVNQRISSVGNVAREDIKMLRGKFYDGHALCNLKSEDYFVHDGHPNASGYAKISECVIAALRLNYLPSISWTPDGWDGDARQTLPEDWRGRRVSDRSKPIDSVRRYLWDQPVPHFDTQ